MRRRSHRGVPGTFPWRCTLVLFPIVPSIGRSVHLFGASYSRRAPLAFTLADQVEVKLLSWCARRLFSLLWVVVSCGGPTGRPALVRAARLWQRHQGLEVWWILARAEHCWGHGAAPLSGATP